MIDNRANGSDAVKRFVANCESPHLRFWALFADAKVAAQTMPTPLYSLSALSQTSRTRRV